MTQADLDLMTVTVRKRELDHLDACAEADVYGAIERADGVVRRMTSTHLNPVAQTEQEARLIAKARLNQEGQIKWWDIRKGFDGYYVVPSRSLGCGIHEVDQGYASLGNYVGREARER